MVNADGRYRVAGGMTLIVEARDIFDAQYETFSVGADPSEGIPTLSTARFLSRGAPLGVWGSRSGARRRTGCAPRRAHPELGIGASNNWRTLENSDIDSQRAASSRRLGHAASPSRSGCTSSMNETAQVTAMSAWLMRSPSR